MQINSLQSLGSIQQLARTNATRTAEPLQPTSQASNSLPVDQLDLSAEAQQLVAAEATGGDVRADRVATIRQALADGTYETPEKLSVALDRLLDQFA